MMVAFFVALVESTGAFIAVARYAPFPPSILSRGVGWQGVGILLAGILGTGNGTSILKILGFLALTRVGSRRVTQIAAGFMIFFSILGKFGAVFASIPAPIVAALYCLFFAYMLQWEVNTMRLGRIGDCHGGIDSSLTRLIPKSEEFYSLPFNLNKFFSSI
ncbi:transporter [Lithospermum erythrorhizon]|uniref:Transporter n=1 Tax=Lithospermum erythrorhizon TaxID=34254 RepID=A0AAV3P7L9_LITER